MRKALKDIEGTVALVRFTGKAGGTAYLYEGGKSRLDKGQAVRVTVKGHWLALVASGDAEIVR
ncbi:MAG: hypothetical protein JXA87_07840 [Thermoleophilia bacterium]|nr:hypothetical protein [Thermoleophilia bacterium]